MKTQSLLILSKSIRCKAERFVLIVCLLLVSLGAIAQQTVVTGIVTDKQGAPLPGATIKVNGTSIGTTSTVEGKFRFSVPKDSRVIRVSFIGMKTAELPIPKDGSILNIALEDENTGLDEVVVIGYGTTTRRDLTGSVSSVSGKTLTEIPVSSLAAALTGRMAGVQVTSTDGDVDAEVKIRVRGGGSITQDNSPLYLVDGFPVDDIKDIPSSEIASIDVLKDASSTAIYGARGSNGVILITTKEAKSGKTTISYNGYYQTKIVPKFLDMMDPYQFVMLQYELINLKGQADYITSFKGTFGEAADLDIYKNIPGVNRQKALFGQTAQTQNHNLSISGGGKDSKFNINYNYSKDNGHIVNSGIESHNINFKFKYNLYKQLVLDLSARYSNSSVTGAGNASVKSALSYRPVKGKTVVDPNFDESLIDDINTQSSLYDPVTLALQDYKNQKRESMEANGALTWDVIKNLKVKSEFGMRSSESNTRRFYGPLTNTAITNGGLPLASITQNTSPRWKSTNTANYKFSLQKDNSLDVLAGYELLGEQTNSIQSLSRKFPSDIERDVAFAMMSTGTQEYTYTNESGENMLESFFGRVNYGYKGRYLFTGTLRADGSSKFSPQNRWGYFPSAALAWRASDEAFLKQVDAISNLKLRVSYGVAGNNRINNDMWRRTYNAASITSGSPVIGFDDLPSIYYKVTSDVLINPDLKWESTLTRNLGLDFGFFKQRISGSLEFYWNTTKDLLIQSPIPTYTGYTYQLRNVGQTSNKGIELNLNADIIRTKDFTFNVAFNISTNQNRVDKLDGVNSKYFKSGWASTTLKETEDYQLIVGQAVGLMYGYVTDGFYSMDDFTRDDVNSLYILKPGVANSKNITKSLGTSSSINVVNGVGDGAGPSLGSLKLKDLDNDGVITSADRKVIGNANPKHSGGINFTSTYKNIDCSLFFNWVYGNNIYNANKIYFTSYSNTYYYNMLNIMSTENRFRYYNDDGVRLTSEADLRELNKNATMWSPGLDTPVFHSWAVEDGSFLRLSNITVGYTIPKQITKKVSISSCRFYGTINNAWIWTKYSGYDPEVDSRRDSPLTPGVDWNSFPKSRTFTLGVNLIF